MKSELRVQVFLRVRGAKVLLEHTTWSIKARAELLSLMCPNFETIELFLFWLSILKQRHPPRYSRVLLGPPRWGGDPIDRGAKGKGHNLKRWLTNHDTIYLFFLPKTPDFGGQSRPYNRKRETYGRPQKVPEVKRNFREHIQKLRRHQMVRED